MAKSFVFFPHGTAKAKVLALVIRSRVALPSCKQGIRLCFMFNRGLEVYVINISIIPQVNIEFLAC
jgi:hypothetical protein